MRDLLLREWQPQIEELAPEERDEVMGAGLCQLRPVGQDRYELRPESIVGTAVSRRVRLVVRPKIGVRNVFFLLSYATGLTTWRHQESFPYGEDDDLFAVVANFFEAEVARAEGHGLARDYRSREESLPTLRGRIDIGAQVTRRLGQPFPIDCRYEEYTEDTELNRVLKACFRRLLSLPGLDNELVRRLRHRARAFKEVETVDYVSGSLPSVAFTRLNDHWEAAGRIAELVLRQQSLRDTLGRRTGIAFVVDMNRVFEGFIEALVRREVRRAGWELVPQAPRRLSPGISMQPDLVLRRNGRDWSVADAKYKRVKLELWPNADLYQLLAYCVGLGLPEGTLIYADYEGTGAETVLHHGAPLATLRMRGIDLTGPPAAVLERGRDLARELIVRAERNRRKATSLELLAA